MMITAFNQIIVQVIYRGNVIKEEEFYLDEDKVTVNIIVIKDKLWGRYCTLQVN